MTEPKRYLITAAHIYNLRAQKRDVKFDLTQLTPGPDRDSSLVAHLYDERNSAVKAIYEVWLLKQKQKGPIMKNQLSHRRYDNWQGFRQRPE